MTVSIRVLVVDDHPLMREAIAAAVGDEADMVVAGQCANGTDAVEQALALQPDVTIMDLFMPGSGGLQAIEEIKAKNPSTRILVLTSSSDEAIIVASIEAGALGYILKDSSREVLLQAVRAVAKGEAYLPQNIALKLMNRLHQASRQSSQPSDDNGSAIKSVEEVLTEREFEILKYLGKGYSNREIARGLCLSEATVRAHIYHILQKLNLEHRSQAVAYAAKLYSSIGY